jgi:hypothetical protein
MAKFRFILTIGIVTFILLLSACGSSSNNTGLSPQALAADILSKARAKTPFAAKYTATLQSIVKGEAIGINMTVEYTSKPIVIHTLVATSSGSTSTIVETISTNDATYVKLAGSDKWIKSPAMASVDISSLKTTQYVKNIGAGGLKYVGKESLNGKDVYHLRGDISSTSDVSDTMSPDSGTADFWITADKYYLIKLEAPGKDKDKNEVKVNVLVSAWDDDVKITLPDSKDIAA